MSSRDASATPTTRELQIAHVLFMDIVAYSQLPMDHQSRLIGLLQQTVRETEEFARAQKRHQLLSLPSGDGMALVFFGDAEAPIRCACEISRALRKAPELKLRMGVHTGPVHRVEDINANRNVAGGGINLAQRVMDCGDAGHILASKSVADTLAQLSTWKAALHDLGEAEVKHGVRIRVYNIYTDEFGNAALPTKLRTARKKKMSSRAMWSTATILAIALLALGILHFRQRKVLTDRDTIVLADFINNTGEAVFNDTLKQGLTVDLQQSPFLNILAEDAVNRQLRYMGRTAEDRLTAAVAREVCVRQGVKAMLVGSISGMGSHYAITLKAMNCQDSSLLDEEQVEADSRETVLTKLHEISVAIRNRLGESLASIQRYDTPLQQATTSSLEALQAYTMASRTFRVNGEQAAIPLYQHAIELDPKFAMAYADLAVMYNTLNQLSLAAEFATKAYGLRERVTEREKFYIDSTYYMFATGEQEKAARIFEQWTKIYPRDLVPYINLGLVDSSLGLLEKALATDSQAFQLTKDAPVVYANLAYDYTSLNRVDDAASILDQAQQRKLDDTLLPNFYQVAFLRGDTARMQQCLSLFPAKSEDEDALWAAHADTVAFYGRLRQARILTSKAVDAALRADSKEEAADWQVTAALREAEFGNVTEAQQAATSALNFASNRAVQIAAALALARVGEVTRAQSLADDLQKRFPTNTLLNSLWLPTINGAIALQQHDAARAIKLLEPTSTYELGGAPPPFTSGSAMYAVYLRGEALLMSQSWADAARELQKILDHRGLVGNFPLGALAHLQLARAYAGERDTANARSQYQEFLSLWKDGDQNLPLLLKARTESAALR